MRRSGVRLLSSAPIPGLLLRLTQSLFDRLLDKPKFAVVNCARCRHYYVTWDERFPQGCSLYGVKSRQAPSIAVKNATGAPCQFWETKPAKSSG